MHTTNDLRITFNKDSEQYNRYRPYYPAELFECLIKETNIKPGDPLLEIGPGTGQATEPLAKAGYEITGVELGANLASKARQVLAGYPHTKIITGTFEETVLPPNHFSLIYSATAFHWISQENKFAKTARLLKPRGYLAVIYTEHISDEKGDAFFHASQPLYDRYTNSEPTHTPEAFQLPKGSDLKTPTIDTDLFEEKGFYVFPSTITYSAEDYAGLLSTYSPIIALPSSKRQQFLSGIEQLIANKFGGSIRKEIAFTLVIAQKK